MTLHQKRRFIWLYTPAVLLGLTLNIISYFHSLTFNGLTLIATAIIFATVIVAVRDWEKTYKERL